MIYQDFRLEFTTHPVKKDLLLVQDGTAVVQSIRNLILMNHYEAPFQPDKGCNIRRQLFEPMSSFVASDIARWIQETIANFEPRAELTTVRVVPDEQNNAYHVSLELFLDTVTTPLTVDFLLERLN